MAHDPLPVGGTKIYAGMEKTLRVLKLMVTTVSGFTPNPLRIMKKKVTGKNVRSPNSKSLTA